MTPEQIADYLKYLQGQGLTQEQAQGYFDYLQKADPKKPADPEVSKTESALRGLAQGASLGLSDEITAALESAFGPKKYQEALTETRDIYKAAQKANPKTYLASELGGGIATSFVPGLNVAKAGSLAGVAGRSALQAGIAGAGMSEGDLEDRAKAGVIGATLGAGLGVAGEAAAKGAQRLAGRFAETATGATGKELATKFKPGSGEKLLEKGTVSWFSTPKSIAKKATEELSKASDDIGSSLNKIDPISKDQIMANLFTERAKLLGNEGNRLAVKKLDKEIETFASSASKRDAQDIWNVKKAFEEKVNWLAKQTKPSSVQSNERVASALRNAVTDVAEQQSPELAQKFAKERELYSLFKPIKEASERKAATIQQRDIGGMLDSLALLGGGGYGAYKGDPVTGIGYGVGLAALRRGVVPRIPAFAAKTLSNKVSQGLAKRTPVVVGGEVAPNIWEKVKLSEE